MSIKNFNDLPPDVKNSLTTQMQAWKYPSFTPKNLDEIKKKVFETFEYNIRMYWMGRFSKLSTENVKTLEFVSALYLPKEVNFKGVKSGEVLFPDNSHYIYAGRVFEGVWDLYKNTPDMDLPFNDVDKKENGLSKLSKLFKSKI